MKTLRLSDHDYGRAIELPQPEQWEHALRIRERMNDGKLWGIAVAWGIVAVAMVPKPESRGAIALPDNVQRKLTPDMGVVIGSQDPEIQVGDIVAALHGHGMHFQALGEEGIVPIPEVVAIYGAAGGFSPWNTCSMSKTMVFHRYNASQALIAKFMDTATLVPYGDRLLLEFHTPKESEGGILLGDTITPPDPIATVRAIGPSVKDVKVGDRVLFYTGAVTRVLSGNKVVELGFVPEDAILAVVQNERTN